MSARSRSISQTVTRTAPLGLLRVNGEQSDLEIVIKSASIEDMNERDNLYSTRLFTREGTREEFKQGEFRVWTMVRLLAGWNIQDEKHKDVPITSKNVQTWPDPDEFSWMLEQIYEFNPTWQYGFFPAAQLKNLNSTSGTPSVPPSTEEE